MKGAWDITFITEQRKLLISTREEKANFCFGMVANGTDRQPPFKGPTSVRISFREHTLF